MFRQQKQADNDLCSPSDIKRYKQIDVPSDLLPRILEARQVELAQERRDDMARQPVRPRPRFRASPVIRMAVAALAVLFLSFGLYYRNDRVELDLLAISETDHDQVAPASVQRYVSPVPDDLIVLHFDISSRHAATVTVDAGKLVPAQDPDDTRIAAIQTIRGGSSFLWELEPDINQVYLLTVEARHKTDVYQLRYDLTEYHWVLEERTNP